MFTVPQNIKTLPNVKKFSYVHIKQTVLTNLSIQPNDYLLCTSAIFLLNNFSFDAYEIEGNCISKFHLSVSISHCFGFISTSVWRNAAASQDENNMLLSKLCSRSFVHRKHSVYRDRLLTTRMFQPKYFFCSDCINYKITTFLIDCLW